MKKYTNLTKGFTLVELMVTLAVMGIMAAIAFPSMSNFISNTRLTNRAGQVANLFRFAKGEAVRLGVPVVVCGVKVRTDGRPSGVCSPSSVSSGMMAYADNNKNGMYDDGTDVMLRSVSINGNDNPEKMTVEVNKCKVDGTGCTTDSIVEYVFFANGMYGSKKVARTTQTDLVNNVEVAQSFLRVRIKDVQRTNLAARNTVVAPSGAAAICQTGSTSNAADGFSAIMKTVCDS